MICQLAHCQDEQSVSALEQFSKEAICAAACFLARLRSTRVPIRAGMCKRFLPFFSSGFGNVIGVLAADAFMGTCDVIHEVSKILR